MKKAVYRSKIDRPQVHVTARGTRYVRAWDIIRSDNGRAVILALSKEAAGGGVSQRHKVIPSTTLVESDELLPD